VLVCVLQKRKIKENWQLKNKKFIRDFEAGADL